MANGSSVTNNIGVVHSKKGKKKKTVSSASHVSCDNRLQHIIHILIDRITNAQGEKIAIRTSNKKQQTTQLAQQRSTMEYFTGVRYVATPGTQGAQGAQGATTIARVSGKRREREEDSSNEQAGGKELEGEFGDEEDSQ